MTPKGSKTKQGNRALTKDGPFPKEIVEAEVPKPELCSAEYSATIVPVPDAGEEVFIEANGVHSTGGYEVFFQKSPLEVYPPQFSLWHIRPSGPSTDVLTPFTVFTSFKKAGDVTYVVVVDKTDRHKVKVQRLGQQVCE